MLIFLYGPDSYHRLKKTNHIIDRYQTKHPGLSFRLFDLTSDDPSLLPSLISFSNTQSLFESHKLARLKNSLFLSSAPYLKIIQSMIDSSHTTLILESDKAPPSKFSFLLNKPVESQFFPLDSNTIKNTIKELSSFYNLTLSPDIISNLTNYYTQDLNGLINELEQLSLLNSSPTLSHIKKLRSIKNYELFFLVKKLASPNQIDRLTSLSLISKIDSAKLFNLLAYQPNISKTKAASLDKDIKSGRLEYPEALLDLVLS